nr:DNA-binding protein [Massilia sp. BJB1822]
MYKSDVRKARDSLIAQSVYPSVDAVRIALGNTGSKSTIHKYLKELEAEEGSQIQKASISDALQDLVERLAARLQEEADVRLTAAMEDLALQKQEHAATLRRFEGELAEAHEASRKLEAGLRSEVTAHEQTRKVMQAETIARHTAEQQVTDLKERLAENETHRVSLEDKHAHARQALEHYRQTSKEQRDQELRRHEQQVQQLQADIRLYQQAAAAKQEELTKLNQEGARLVAELSQARVSLYDAQRLGREQASKLEFIPALEQKLRSAQERLTERDQEFGELAGQLQRMEDDYMQAQARIQQLEVELAGVRAAAQSQTDMAAELHKLFKAHESAAQPGDRP